MIPKEQDIKRRASKFYRFLKEEEVSDELAYAQYAGYIKGALEQAERDKKECPSDETIMRVLNCIGYEECSWIETVKKNWAQTGRNKK